VLRKKNNASAVSNVHSLEQTQLLLRKTVPLSHLPYFPAEELGVFQSKNQLLISCWDLKWFRSVCFIQQHQEFSVTSSWKKNPTVLKILFSKVTIYFYPKCP